MLIVEKLPWGNTLEVTRGVEVALQEMRPGLPGIQIDSTIFRPATFVEAAIGNLSRALLLGSLLVILILVLFLYDWRAAVISAVAIPLSLLAAGFVLYLRATTINTMILAGLVISVGVVVDEAIIDVENIVRRLRLHRLQNGDRSLAATSRIVLSSSLEVRSAIGLRDPDRRRGGRPGLLHGGADRCVLPAAGPRLRPWRCWPPWPWP
jgi:Cu/Ag efflux pump CusA